MTRARVLDGSAGALRDEDLRVVLEALRASEPIVYPTETLYGLGANALDARAVERVRAIKGRPEDKPFPLLVDGEEMLARLVGEIPAAARALIASHWPGPLTLVLRARAELPAGVRGADGTVACRLSSSELATGLVQALGAPLVATSANRAGEPASRELAPVLEALGAEVALAIDGGALPGRLGSTIVDVTGAHPRVLRAGDLALDPRELA